MANTDLIKKNKDLDKLTQGLTNKERMFCEYYAIYGDEKKALKHADYKVSKKNTGISIDRLFARPEIQRYIAFLRGTELNGNTIDHKKMYVWKIEVLMELINKIKKQKLTHNSMRAITMAVGELNRMEGHYPHLMKQEADVQVTIDIGRLMQEYKKMQEQYKNAY